MDFKNAKELLALCEERKLCISDVMRRREIEKGEITGEICDARMKKAYEIMRESALRPHKKARTLHGRSAGRRGERCFPTGSRAAEEVSVVRFSGKSHCICHGCSGDQRFYGTDRGGAYGGLLRYCAGRPAGAGGAVSFYRSRDDTGSLQRRGSGLSGHAERHRGRRCGRLSGPRWA